MSQTFQVSDVTENLGLPLWGETPPDGATGLDLRNAILGEDENSMARLLDALVERLANKITHISDDATDDQYPSARAVKDYVSEMADDLLPEINDDDEGKILGVVDGQWTTKESASGIDWIEF